MPVTQIIRHILVGLSIVLLIYAFKNYITFIVNGSDWCRHLCPSTFGWNNVDTIPVLGHLFLAQEWLHSISLQFIDRAFSNHRNLLGVLIVAPVIEELIYRGPMYIAKKHSNHPAWWVIGIVLSIVFALSHGRSGVALMPLLALGMYNLWLVAKTQRIWPAISLHFLNNLIIISFSVYPSIWFSD